MSRKKWSPLRRHFTRYMLYYLLALFLVVFIGGIAVSVLLATKFVQREAQARFGPQSYVLSKEGKRNFLADRSSNQSSDLILPFCQVRSINLTVYLPGCYRDIAGIAYHEARNDKAFSLEPIGYLLKNDNTYKVDVSLDQKTPLPTYYIMETRYEDQSATSAADVAMKEGASVLSPVNGVVSKVESKILYGYYEDTQIEIIPLKCDDIRVVIIHVKEVKVSPGQIVKQGKTALGIPRDYREHFQSEIDDYVKPAHPHVQVQVNRYVPEAPPQ